MLDVKLLKFIFISLCFDQISNLFSLLDKHFQNLRQYGCNCISFNNRRRHFFNNFFFSRSHSLQSKRSSIEVLSFPSFNCCKANIVFLDDWWIKWVEVKKNDNFIIQARLWFQNQSSCIFGLLSSLLLRLFIIVTLIFLVIKLLLLVLVFIWTNVVMLSVLMK